ncbi:hypothetical protein ABB37_07309 [Leptomonas pyrrhocoris]|uniref:Uncharacterized protein n=1 Tax=Leptomonas pyrrhocoris TaxID=157538 RepID=A0A0M9FVH5_LEPPY|nr:hypothetical protein ABB37_07309 [Leptomonas pyrrhocoris]KPA76930.1 hypothetical protein ABB37_07309 [Leptomonas pyrrhocoris]|eukprot:XP_015655369.1 hypothetical protein ABB37_07309 [Leptomonas pyrrhocoris]
MPSSSDDEGGTYAGVQSKQLLRTDQRYRHPPSRAPPIAPNCDAGKAPNSSPTNDVFGTLTGAFKSREWPSDECCRPLRSRSLRRRLVRLSILFLFVLLLGAVLLRQIAVAPSTRGAGATRFTARTPLPSPSPPSHHQPATPTAAVVSAASATTTLLPTPAEQNTGYRAQPLPATWAQGGGSVRIARAFTVLTVATGPPLTSEVVAAAAAAVSTSPPQQAVVLLRRAARHLLMSGMTRHHSIHEWLIMHNEVFTGAKAIAAAAEEEEVVRRWWWTGEQGAPTAPAPNPRDQQTREAQALLSSRVRVVGLPHSAVANPHATKRAFTLLYGVRLVQTEYVLVHDLHRVLVTSLPSLALENGAAMNAAAARSNRVHEHVQHEVTLALQALSKNALAGLSHTLVDQARASPGEEDVHAYRLQVYASVDRHDAAREAELQTRLVAFVKKVVAPAPLNTTAAESPANTKRDNSEEDGKAAAVTVREVQDGLPVAAYSTAPHFHCLRAPLYSIRVPVPPWMRAPHRTRSPATAATVDPHHNVSSTVAPPALSTLCEVLLSSRSGMPVDYAPGVTVFHRSFCQEWLQFTLLPSPTTPRDTNVAENPLLIIGKAAAAQGGHDDAFAQRMDMAQSLGDGLCTVEWVAHLKAAQLWYTEQAERRRRPGMGGLKTNTSATAGAEHASLSNATVSPVRNDVAMSNLVGAAPYLDQYAALLFSDDAARVSKLAGTYLAFLPNVSYAIQHMRRTMEDKLAQTSLKYAAERTRRFKSKKEPTDREVLCLPSHLARVELHSTMYNTQWFLTQLVMRCLQHKEKCLGDLAETDVRVSQNVDRYLSTTGKWGRGEFRVCMSGGVYVEDPLTQLP